MKYYRFQAHIKPVLKHVLQLYWTFYALLVKTEYAISLTLPKVNKLEFQGIIIELFLNKEKYKGPSQKNDFSTEGYSLQHISIHYKISIFTTLSLSYNHLFRIT